MGFSYHVIIVAVAAYWNQTLLLMDQVHIEKQKARGDQDLYTFLHHQLWTQRKKCVCIVWM